jgi:hypothetical protein
MDAKTAPSANTDRATNATSQAAGRGHAPPQAARQLTTRAVDTATAVAGKTVKIAAYATTRVGSGVHDASGRVADLMRRRPIGWAAIAAGVTGALASAVRWRRIHAKPRSRAARTWRQISHRTSGQAKRLTRRLRR